MVSASCILRVPTTDKSSSFKFDSIQCLEVDCIKHPTFLDVGIMIVTFANEPVTNPLGYVRKNLWRL